MDTKQDNKNSKIIINGCYFNNWDKYAYTVFIFINHFAYGITCTTFGPAMVDMKYIFNTSMDKISLYQTFYSIGYLIGSLFGFLYKYMNRQIVITGIVAVMSAAVALVPYSPELWLLFVCALIIGIGSGAWDNCLYVWLIEMWQHRSPTILQISQFMFGSGTIVGPLLDQPYIIGEPDSDNATDIWPFNASSPMINVTDLDRRSSLKTPFMINGGLQIIAPILFVVMFFAKKYVPPVQQSVTDTVGDECEKSKSNDAIESTQTARVKSLDRPESPRKLFIALSALFIGSYLTLELAQFQFSATYYQFIPLRLSAPKAAQMVSIMAAAYTIARGVSAVIAIKVKPHIMLSYHFLILLVSIVMLPIGQNSYHTLWAANLIIGVGMSALWAGMFAFVEQYIEITNRVSAVFIFICGLMSAISPFILGPFIETFPNVLIICEFAYFTACVGLFAALLCIVSRV